MLLQHDDSTINIVLVLLLLFNIITNGLIGPQFTYRRRRRRSC